MEQFDRQRYRAAAWVAGASGVAAYGLIALGGMVHNTGSSLACPDWPLCHGEWLPAMRGGVLYEHSHRLLGAVVGLGIVVLNGLLWRLGPPRRWALLGLVLLPALAGGTLLGTPLKSAAITAGLSVCLTLLAAMGLYLLRTAPPALALARKALALLALVLLQGLLGGTTVKYQLPHLISTAHLALSMIILLALVYLAWGCWRGARSGLTLERPEPIAPDGAAARSASALYTIAAVAVYCQIVLGAFVRHTMSATMAGWGWRYAVLGMDPNTGTYALWPTYPPAALNLLHRYLAVLIAGIVILTCARGWSLLGPAFWRGRAGRAWLPAGLVLAQIVLGVVMLGAWNIEGPEALARAVQITLRTAHLAVATALLVSIFYLRLLTKAAVGENKEIQSTGATARDRREDDQGKGWSPPTPNTAS